MTTLPHTATILATCMQGCGWQRVLDVTRSYRGGHTHPETGEDCYGALQYEMIDERPPEVALLGLPEPLLPPGFLSDGSPELEQRVEEERPYRAELERLFSENAPSVDVT
jgi:hypothetical protein